jgi:uncharacterized protein (TIGR02145 family)
MTDTTMTDVENNVYQTMRIGNQMWTENLRTTKYNDGTAIPHLIDSASWDSSHYIGIWSPVPAYCYYGNTTNIDSIKKYGALYTWDVIVPSNPKKIAPTGWHVPSIAEWDTLMLYLVANGSNWNGSTNQYNKIAKALAAKTDWVIYSVKGTIGCDLTKNNSSNFTALPSGFRGYNGGFSSQGTMTGWWTPDTTCGAFQLYNNFDDLIFSEFWKTTAFSIRLVKD